MLVVPPYLADLAGIFGAKKVDRPDPHRAYTARHESKELAGCCVRFDPGLDLGCLRRRSRPPRRTPLSIARLTPPRRKAAPIARRTPRPPTLAADKAPDTTTPDAGVDKAPDTGDRRARRTWPPTCGGRRCRRQDAGHDPGSAAGHHARYHARHHAATPHADTNPIALNGCTRLRGSNGAAAPTATLTFAPERSPTRPSAA